MKSSMHSVHVPYLPWKKNKDKSFLCVKETAIVT